jgi:hypothetical protein
MDHNEIRFKILYTLYQKHYSPELERAQDTEKIIRESGLGDIDKNQVAGDIVYLENKYLIKGVPLIGHIYSPWIKITSYGIDFVDMVVDRFTRNFENENIDYESKSKVRELLKQNNNRSAKIQNVVDLGQKYTSLWLKVM